MESSAYYKIDIIVPLIIFALTFLKINAEKLLIDLIGFIAMDFLLICGGIFLNYLLSKGK